jgi:hypothetical protein
MSYPTSPTISTETIVALFIYSILAILILFLATPIFQHILERLIAKRIPCPANANADGMAAELDHNERGSTTTTGTDADTFEEGHATLNERCIRQAGEADDHMKRAWDD